MAARESKSVRLWAVREQERKTVNRLMADGNRAADSRKLDDLEISLRMVLKSMTRIRKTIADSAELDA